MVDIEDHILDDLWLSRNPEYLKVKEYVSRLHKEGEYYYYRSCGFADMKIVKTNIVYFLGSTILEKLVNFDFYLLKALNLTENYTITHKILIRSKYAKQ